MGMFAETIDNDLALVDTTIRAYYQKEGYYGVTQ
jgi:hypothetical protein